MPEKGEQKKAGLQEIYDPRQAQLGKGTPPAHTQEWPGKEKEMKPQADHGEQSYKGSGKLEGKTALITGGDSGIGRAVAIAFAREGADVAIAYYSEEEDAQETERWIKQAGRQALRLPGDLRDPQHCENITKQVVHQWGHLDILVNNAAYQHEVNSIREVTPEQLEQTFKTNVYANIWMTQAAMPYLKSGGAIINTTSITALVGHPALPDYAATKAAILNLTQSLAKELAPSGVRVNAVAPGPVWTPLIPSTKSVEGFGESTLWKRPAQPAEIAPSYVFLASSDSKFYTGETLAPTGSATTR